MILLFDIGNTHTHLGLASRKRISRARDIPTRAWFDKSGQRLLRNFVGQTRVDGIALCSVVPRSTPRLHRVVRRSWGLSALELNAETILGVGVNYPQPQTIGPDRLANAIAVKHRFGSPAVFVDFGTAVTFDVVDKRGDYVGGIIVPGLAAMTDYLHEKTALLPKIEIRDIGAVIGKNTEQAMLIGAVHGYRGLIRELIVELKKELNCRRLPVVATGGYADLIAGKLSEITAVDPLLTLEGLRLFWNAHQPNPFTNLG
jgi:type III pantothenate kinase